MSRGVLYEIPWPPELEAYLTHYFVMCLGNQRVPIGEAADVQQLGPARWHALVGRWGRNPVTGEIDSRVFAHVCEMNVFGPDFQLVPKDSFHASGAS